MLDGPAVVKDSALSHTSAWANAFTAHDHRARGDEPPSRNGQR